MKTDSRLIYAIIGSLITLAFFFIFKIAFLSDELILDTPVSQQNSNIDNSFHETQTELDQKIEKSAKKTSSDAINNSADKKTDFSLSSTLKQCKENCLYSIIASIDPNNVSLEQATQIADFLIENPHILVETQALQSSLKDQTFRNTIVYIYSKLPDGQLQQVARDLSSSEKKSDRDDALSLLRLAANENVDVHSEIKQIITTENDPAILLKAINLSHTLDPNLRDPKTQGRLSNLINTNTNDGIRSVALSTKTKVINDTSELKTDIFTALTSSTKKFTEAGLRSLDTVLDLGETDDNSEWQRSTELRKTLEEISNNLEADSSTRNEALNLIKKHYN